MGKDEKVGCIIRRVAMLALFVLPKWDTSIRSIQRKKRYRRESGFVRRVPFFFVSSSLLLHSENAHE